MSTQSSCRDWNEFFNRDRFSWPQNNQHWIERSDMNLAYYRYNYLYCALGIFVIASFTSPMFYVIYGLFYYGIQKIRGQPEIVIAEIRLEKPAATLLLVIVTLFLLLVFGGDTIFKAILLTLLASVGHATFHMRPFKSKFISIWADITGRQSEYNEIIEDTEDTVASVFMQVYKYLDYPDDDPKPMASFEPDFELTSNSNSMHKSPRRSSNLSKSNSAARAMASSPPLYNTAHVRKRSATSVSSSNSTRKSSFKSSSRPISQQSSRSSSLPKREKTSSFLTSLGLKKRQDKEV
eukprot:CFRG5353T1